jgi:hypothetical protein
MRSAAALASRSWRGAKRGQAGRETIHGGRAFARGTHHNSDPNTSAGARLHQSPPCPTYAEHAAGVTSHECMASPPEAVPIQPAARHASRAKIALGRSPRPPPAHLLLFHLVLLALRFGRLLLSALRQLGLLQLVCEQGCTCIGGGGTRYASRRSRGEKAQQRVPKPTQWLHVRRLRTRASHNPGGSCPRWCLASMRGYAHA